MYGREIMIMIMKLNWYSAKTIEEYSKELSIKLKLMNKSYKKLNSRKKCFKLLFKNDEAATCSSS